MANDVLLLAASFSLGLAAQLPAHADRLRDLVWLAFFWTLAPVLVFTTFATFPFDRELARTLAAVVIATWAVAAAGYAYARLAAPRRDERGALALAIATPNTGFVGYPIAQLWYGDVGLALAVIYDRLSWLVPATSVTTAVARLHGLRAVPTRRRPLLAILANPPLWAMAAALLARWRVGDVEVARDAQDVVAPLVGPIGFFLLGLAIPLEPIAHARDELARAAGAMAIRFAAAPLALVAAGRAFGADVPGAFYLLAAMPPAFHLIVLARVYDVRPPLMRLLVVGSTVPAVAVAIVVAWLRQ